MEAIQQMAAVAGVLSLLVAVLWWLRHRGFAIPALPVRSGARRLECLERVALGPQQSLHLVRMGGTALLVASSPAGCSLLTTQPYREIAGEAAE